MGLRYTRETSRWIDGNNKNKQNIERLLSVYKIRKFLSSKAVGAEPSFCSHSRLQMSEIFSNGT